MIIVRRLEPVRQDVPDEQYHVILAHRIFLSQLGKTIQRGGRQAALDAVTLMLADTVYTCNDDPQFDVEFLQKVVNDAYQVLAQARANRGIPKS